MDLVFVETHGFTAALPDLAMLGLVDVYDKNESEDLSASQRGVLSQIADGLRRDLEERRRKR